MSTKNTTDLPETDHETRSPDPDSRTENPPGQSFLGNLKYAAAGLFFGIVAVKSEIVSWFRIQEMFRFGSFHMYGVIGTAVVVGAVSIFLIKRLKIKTLRGGAITFCDKKFHRGQVIGGLIFGCGWAITGACPGPLFAQIGSGYLAVTVTLFSAIAGTWAYGFFREKLPH